MDLLFGEVTTKVPLPAWIFEQAGDDEQEMKRYEPKKGGRGDGESTKRKRFYTHRP